MKDALAHGRRLFELVRFSHTAFALPFALLAALMAWTTGAAATPPRPWRGAELAGILICMVAARTAAMAVNRLADAKWDALNPRTAGRHIPTGRVSVPSAITLVVICSGVFVAGTLLFLPNRLPLYLSAAVLAFLFGYSYTKRFTSWSHFYLGAALMLAPISVWVAIRGPVVVHEPADLIPVVILGAAVLVWVAGFDILYACQDLEFDRQVGLQSIPARWGLQAALWIAALCHLATVALLAALPHFYPHFGWLYRAGVGAVLVLLIYEHTLLRPDDLRRVNLAFFYVNVVVSGGLLLVGTLDLLL
ncbi:MAG: 4-hydroxybenzoate octaprenyltransferase [Planctomycetes bacterium RBG_16_64_10]|nr:MAG: 4-hydroxybenzoate octaprenyltransferase [Planctomycetes bacterium RBG_16_64_10]